MHLTRQLVVWAVLGYGASAFAQEIVIDPDRVELWDVIYVKDGSIWKGVIVEQVPGERYRIVLSGGSVMVIDAGQVDRIAKERNPRLAAPPAPAGTSTPGSTAAPVETDTPGPMVDGGVRVGGSVGVAIPFSDFGEGDTIGSSLHLRARIGGELFPAGGRISITPAARFDFVGWSVDGEGLSPIRIGLSGELRAAAHVGRVVPYAAIAFGFDLSGFTGQFADQVEPSYGFGLELEFGMDIIATPEFALGPSLVIHPGFNKFADAPAAPDVTYIGVGINGTYLD